MSTDVRVRPAVVAGLFYPADADTLAATVDDAVAHAMPWSGEPPKALVVPHAGYVYSGPVAATGYRALAALRDTVHRVVLLGPAHHVGLRGLAVSSADAFVTPLGLVPVDTEARAAVLAVAGVVVDDHVHAPEHSLEVHLPFLQRTLGDFAILPLVVGAADARTVAAVLDTVWGGPETLIVVSSDLSHYLDHDAATRRDRATAAAIVAGDTDTLTGADACGATPLRGLCLAARTHGLTAELVDLRTSADTAGDPSRVVGYGTFLFGPSSSSGRR
jgi:MEMO1 family protein